MSKTMKAAVVRELGKPLALEQVAVPDPNENQILVRIAATGICHTDLHAVKGDWPVKPKTPFIPGHEGVGTVAAVGRAVRGVKEGDRVGIPWLHAAWALLTVPDRVGAVCGSQLNSGYSVNGSFAEYALADPAYVGRLPDNLEWGPAAPILCAGVTVYKGLRETEVRPGEWVVIRGSAAWATWRSNTRRRWACTSPRSMCIPRSSRSPSHSVRRSRLTHRPPTSRPRCKG